MKARLLIVDDDPAARYGVRRALSALEVELHEAESGEQALEVLAQGVWGLVILDVSMPGMGGLECLDRIVAREQAPPVIMLTAYGSERLAVDCLRRGAYDYLPKPYEVDELLVSVERALERGRLLQENSVLRRRLASLEPAASEWRSASMRKVSELIATFAPTDVTVLLLGESGTGKEVMARRLHRRSRRGDGPFVALNCAALPEQLVESELFGHEKGAFTGAGDTRKGRFEAAHEGSLFLDEVGDMALDTQAKLLRVIQERSLERLGSNRSISVDVRLIAASNHDLAAQVRAGRFREDLYFRLAVAEIRVPPLRERREDLPALVEQLLDEVCSRLGVDNGGLAAATLPLLVEAPWPGNVRELRNALEYAAVVARGRPIAPEMLPDAVTAAGAPTATSLGEPADERLLELPYLEAKREAVAAFDRSYLEHQLRAAQGNISEAARKIGIARQSLQGKLRELGIDPLEFRLRAREQDS